MCCGGLDDGTSMRGDCVGICGGIGVEKITTACRNRKVGKQFVMGTIRVVTWMEW